MCVINGFNYKDLSLIKKISALTSYREPDNEGFYSNEDYTVGHNRLSIINPETRSNQPFHFKNYILSFCTTSFKKNYYDSSHHINLDECKKLIMRHKEEYCDPFLIWHLISLQIFFKKLQTLK